MILVVYTLVTETLLILPAMILYFIAVMNETNCHIHFPDSNRTSCKEKSNQVSLSGTEKGVEEARVRVRVSSLSLSFSK